MKLYRLFTLTLTALLLTLSAEAKAPTYTMSRETLMDKIKGAWAGQVLGCTYGGPTEFKFRGRMIEVSHKISWEGTDQVTGMMKSWPTLYDDIYMD